ncbi:MAG: peptidoglycan-binding protein [Methyloligellaceae bacterium]
MDVQTIQEALHAAGTYAGKIDGIAGPRTRAAIDAALEARSESLPKGWKRWGARRRQNAYAQLMIGDLDIEVGPIDGLIGPQTRHAIEVFLHVQRTGRKPEPWRDHVPDDEVPPPVRNDWPRQRDVQRFFGNPGGNQTRIELPYSMKIAWNTRQRVTGFSCHEKVHDSMKRVLNRVLDHYGDAEIRRLRLDMFGGCLNVRRMRGGTRWSMHAWGIAVDIDPARNQLKWGRERASLAKPDYEPWWRLWEEEGWLSLGRARNFDWMHVQAARL